MLLAAARSGWHACLTLLVASIIVRRVINFWLWRRFFWRRFRMTTAGQFCMSTQPPKFARARRMTLLITEDHINQLSMSVATAIPVMEDTFRLAGAGEAENPPRTRMPFRNGFLQFGPAALHSRRIAGFKLWANFGHGQGVQKSSTGHGYNYLYDMDTGELLAIVHSLTIGRHRTSAMTAVAVKYLSPADAASVGIYGGGGIAKGQLEAICAVRKIERVCVYSRRPDQRAAFCAHMATRLGMSVTAAEAPEDVVRDADIVVTASTSETPVLRGDWLTRPALVVAAGTNHWYKREIDGGVIERCALVVTDDREQSKVESGNLMWAVSHGLINWNRIAELGDVVAGRVPLPDFGKATILFGSHGLAITQLAIAYDAYERARARGLGTEINL
jgi:alanine dehydrogenase